MNHADPVSPEPGDRPTSICDDVWTDEEPVRILGMNLSATMTILRLADGGVLLHSPITLTPERRAAVDAIGPVAHLYAPNLFHHLHIGQWAQAFPSARLHGPPGLSDKRPDLRIDRVQQAEAESAFAGQIDEIAIEGFRLEESVLFHRPSGTLLTADLVHNVGRPEGAWPKLYTRMMGFYDRIAISRMIRWTAFPDRNAARRSLDRLMALPIERVIVGHGEPIETDARHALAAAYDWLPPTTERS